ADRFARLHQQRLVVAEALELAHDHVEALPRARRLAGAAVDHQIGGPLGHVGIEIVHQHAERGFLRPALAAQLGAVRCANGPHSISVCLRTAARIAPSSSRRRTVCTSLYTGRSVARCGTAARMVACAACSAAFGLCGARKSTPCAAHNSSMASTLRTLSTMR